MHARGKRRERQRKDSRKRNSREKNGEERIGRNGNDREEVTERDGKEGRRRGTAERDGKKSRRRGTVERTTERDGGEGGEDVYDGTGTGNGAPYPLRSITSSI